MSIEKFLLKMKLKMEKEEFIKILKKKIIILKKLMQIGEVKPMINIIKNQLKTIL